MTFLLHCIVGGYCHPFVNIFRFPQLNQSEIRLSVQNLHLHLYWWTCYHRHLEERWDCDNFQCYPQTNQENSWSCCWYLPDSARHWLIRESEWHFGDIQLHSGECQGKIVKDGGCWWVDLVYMLLLTSYMESHPTPFLVSAHSTCEGTQFAPPSELAKPPRHHYRSNEALQQQIRQKVTDVNLHFRS